MKYVHYNNFVLLGLFGLFFALGQFQVHAMRPQELSQEEAQKTFLHRLPPELLDELRSFIKAARLPFTLKRATKFFFYSFIIGFALSPFIAQLSSFRLPESPQTARQRKEAAEVYVFLVMPAILGVVIGKDFVPKQELITVVSGALLGAAVGGFLLYKFGESTT